MADPEYTKKLGQNKLVPLQAKQPPHSIEAEQSVLGGLMLNNPAWFDLADKLVETDFYRADHQLIYRGICELIGANKPCDFVTLSEHLRHQGRLEEAGGVAYLGSLAVDTHNVANVVSYAEIVRERSILRGLIAAGADIGELRYRPEGRSPVELVDRAEQLVFAIRERGARGKQNYEAIRPLLERIEKRIEMLRKDPNALAGLATGFTELDRKTTGLHAGDLVIVAARPGMGKCLVADSELVLDDGSVATIEEVCSRRDQRVGTLRDDLKLDRAMPSGYLDDGIKPVFEVTTQLGRRVVTTAPHPFLTLEGWKPLLALKPGDTVAVPRILPVFGSESMRECEVKLLAYLIGDGGLTGTTPCFTNTNPEVLAEFGQAVEQFGGCIVARRFHPHRASTVAVAADADAVELVRTAFAERLDAAITASGRSARALASDLGVAPASVTYWRQGVSAPGPERFQRLCDVLARVQPETLAPDALAGGRHNQANPLSVWLRAMGLAGKDAHGKCIPLAVFRLPRDQLALFLNRLFATDGWASVSAAGQAQVGYATVSARLARQVQHLLLRFGVVARLRLRWVRYRDSRRPAWQLQVTDGGSLAVFAREIGIFGKQPGVDRVMAALSRRGSPNTDLVPRGVWKLLERAKGVMSWAQLARRAGVADSNVHAGKRGMSRARLARFAMALGDRGLTDLAHSDVYWDRIVSITPAGNQRVYDLTIPDTHNFIADDVCVHNTSFAMNIAEHVAIDRKTPVGVFSMEMSGEQLALRILSSFGRIELGRLRSGQLDDADMDRLVSADALIREAPLYIDETGALSPLELRARARRLVSQHGIKLIIVDYIQLMQVSGTKENRTNEISEISRSLKALAKELALPVIALSQLNRGVEQRDEKRPRLSDLRESGGIEQDADLVMFIYRDEMYYPDKAESKGKAEIIIGKQRSGPTTKFEVTFLGQYTKFDNLADSSFAGP